MNQKTFDLYSKTLKHDLNRITGSGLLHLSSGDLWVRIKIDETSAVYYGGVFTGGWKSFAPRSTTVINDIFLLNKNQFIDLRKTNWAYYFNTSVEEFPYCGGEYKTAFKTRSYIFYLN